MLLTEENCKEELIKIIKLMLTPGDVGNPSVSWYDDELKDGIINKIISSESAKDVEVAINVLRGEDGNYVTNQRYDLFMGKEYQSFEKSDGTPATRLDVLNKYLSVFQSERTAPGFSPNSPSSDCTESKTSSLTP